MVEASRHNNPGGENTMSQSVVQIPFTNGIIQNNVAIKVKQAKGGICIYVEPKVEETYERPDCKNPVEMTGVMTL